MKCNAPIDQETKMALVGEALEAALKDPTSPRCGQELAADDVFCSACGAKVENKFSSQREFVSCDSDSIALGNCINVQSWNHYFKGRVSRRKWWMVWLVAALFYPVGACLVFILYGGTLVLGGVEFPILTSNGKAMLVIVGFIIGIFTVPVAVRRLHDRGNNGKAMIPNVCFSSVLTIYYLSKDSTSFISSFVGACANFVDPSFVSALTISALSQKYANFIDPYTSFVGACASFVDASFADASFVGALVGIMATVYNLFLFVLLGFIRGTKGPNKYGPDPLETK